MTIRSRRHKAIAALCWVGCLFSLALAFESVVLGIEIGPMNGLVIAFIAAALAVAVASAVGFWRYSGALGGRPRGAGLLLLVALAWAAAGAWFLDALIVAFRGA